EAPRPGTSAAPAAEPRSAENPAMATIVLPGGKTLDLEASSSEVGLANALRDPAIALPQSFQLSGLNFESGTATVTSDSSKTLDDLTAILAAYPSSRVRIEGHTDSVGNPAVNQPLSRSRADAVKEMLVSRGISSYRIETAGNREQGSVADNDAEEGRSRNRRADLVLINR
ncbi:MAG: OmpA family protein, partial [Polyangiaceae bacterium]